MSSEKFKYIVFYPCILQVLFAICMDKNGLSSVLDYTLRETHGKQITSLSHTCLHLFTNMRIFVIIILHYEKEISLQRGYKIP
jgi:hypothetical protein